MSTSRMAVIFPQGSAWSCSLLSPLFAGRLWRTYREKLSKVIISLFHNGLKMLVIIIDVPILVSVWFCFLCDWLIIKFRWASLMVISMLINGSCVLSVFFTICLPPAKQRAADRTLPQQYPPWSRLGINVPGVRQDYWTLVSLSCEKLSKSRRNSRLLCSVPSNYESISPLDDLAFDMYQDPEVAHIIRVLDQKKQEMVRQEKYEEAKNLKQAIADLQKVGQPHTKHLISTAFTVCTAEWTSD